MSDFSRGILRVNSKLVDSAVCVRSMTVMIITEDWSKQNDIEATSSLDFNIYAVLSFRD